MEQVTALEQGMVDRLINLARAGYQCELAENDDAARCLEWNVYREACDCLGGQWWAQHEKDCLESRANSVECWEMLLESLESLS